MCLKSLGKPITSSISYVTPASLSVVLITFLNAFNEKVLEFVHNNNEPFGASILNAPLIKSS